MFRPLRRSTKAITEEQMKDLLKTERRGVLAVNGDDGYPYAIPINFIYDDEHGRILFHGARKGHKLDAVRKDDKVCFTVYGKETINEKEAWAPFMQSVVIFGRCRVFEEYSEIVECLYQVAKKYYPDEAAVQEEIAKAGKASFIYEIRIEHMCGKQIQEK